MKILVDTNIVLDALASRKPFSEDAEKIFLLAAKERVEAYVSASSITDIYYVLRKYLSEALSRNCIGRLSQIFRILPVSEAECLQALESAIPDFEDGLQDVCAHKASLNWIITRDETFLRCSPLALRPGAFFEKLEA